MRDFLFTTYNSTEEAIMSKATYQLDTRLKNNV